MSSATRRVAADASAGLSPWPFTGVALVGAVLTVLGFLLYYLQGGLSAAYPPLLWRGEQMVVTRGQGQPVADMLEIRPAEADDGVFFRFAKNAFMARPYGELIWQIEGLDPAQDIRLIWQVQSEPGNVRQAPVQRALVVLRPACLRAHPACGATNAREIRQPWPPPPPPAPPPRCFSVVTDAGLPKRSCSGLGK